MLILSNFSELFLSLYLFIFIFTTLGEVGEHHNLMGTCGVLIQYVPVFVCELVNKFLLIWDQI